MKKPYTQLENDTLEAMARARLTSREFRVMLAVLRLTNGFHLTENIVSLKYLQQLTGLPYNHLYATIKRLSQVQVITKNEDTIACHGPALWDLPSHSPKLGLAEKESRVGPSSDSPNSGVAQIVPVPDSNIDSLKKTYVKENIIKKVPASRGAAAPTSFTDWKRRFDEATNKVGVLIKAFKICHPEAPDDVHLLGGRLGKMVDAPNRGYLLKLIYDTGSVDIKGSRLDYIAGRLRKENNAKSIQGRTDAANQQRRGGGSREGSLVGHAKPFHEAPDEPDE